ncbi:MAG TPA: hypothetical protein VD772_00975, partial [Anseongella sp.]|nr:hypothetical protein [Anseongella sp.]
MSELPTNVSSSGIPRIPDLHGAPELPAKRRPILVIGAGGIVGDAHLPAYEKAGFEVFGIVNRTLGK